MFTQFTQNLNRCTLATIYTHPHIVPNYVLMKIKEDILRNVSVFFSVAIKWKSMVIKTYKTKSFIQNIFFCVEKEIKKSQVWNNKRVNK